MQLEPSGFTDSAIVTSCRVGKFLPLIAFFARPLASLQFPP
jgi:hypothetical protein